MNKINSYLFREVDIAPLALFRVAFGLLIFLEGIGAIFTGWVYDNLIKPEITFPFIGFEWLQPLPGYGMYLWFIVMGIAGLSVMTGYYYKAGISVFTILWTGVYLMQKTSYNNHYYLLILLCLFMLIVPAHRYFSLDVRRRPEIKSLTCPQWCIAIFIIQMFIVYTYASINKMYPAWMSGDTIAIFFSGKTDFFLIGPLLGNEIVHLFVSWGGIFFDLLIVPIMLWKRTRLIGFGMLLFFNLFNSAVFHIGIFPYMMIALAIFFFPPEQVARRFFRKREPLQLSNANNVMTPRKKWFIAGLSIYFLIQVLLPVRHHYFDSNVNWSEEGHRMSWRMMLRSKSGYITFYIQEKGSTEKYPAPEQDLLTRKQNSRVAIRPDMAWQFAQFLHSHYLEEKNMDIAVYAEGKVSLNGSSLRPLIDPETDLASVPWEPFKTKEWVLAFNVRPMEAWIPAFSAVRVEFVPRSVVPAVDVR